MTIRYLSVCSGIEAASVAWEPLGFAPVGFSEIEAFPSAVLAHHYGSNLPGEDLARNGVPNHGDFTTIDPAVVGPVDLLVGGTPCQAFSLAGRRLSLADARGNLTLSYAVLCHELARLNGLRNALWENVPGVLSTEDNAFGCFLGAVVGADDALLPGERPPRGRSNDLWRRRPAGRWPVLDDDGNETGEFLERAEQHIASWPCAGMASGPRARLAWRVLDAKYFGLAQRRKRVFVVVDTGGGADPAEVLFEPRGRDGNSAPRRSAGQGAAGDVAAGAGTGFGGGRLSGPLDVAATLTAKGVRLDFEVETFVGQPIAFPAELSGTQVAAASGLSPALSASHTMAVAFKASHFTRDKDGAPAPVASPLSADADRGDQDALVLAFSCKDHGADVCAGLAPTLRAMPHDGSHANSGGQMAVAYAIQERAVSENLAAGPQGGGVGEETAFTLEARAKVQYVAQGLVVRRLTPMECERLQGFPDGYTAIPRGGKPASECADGPRYRALGNSMAVPVMRWLGERLAAAMPERGAA